MDGLPLREKEIISWVCNKILISKGMLIIRIIFPTINVCFPNFTYPFRNSSYLPFKGIVECKKITLRQNFPFVWWWEWESLNTALVIKNIFKMLHQMLYFMKKLIFPKFMKVADNLSCSNTNIIIVGYLFQKLFCAILCT